MALYAMRREFRKKMQKRKKLVPAKFASDESGAAMAEYVFLVATIALVAIAGASVLGNNLSSHLGNAATCIDNVSKC